MSGMDRAAGNIAHGRFRQRTAPGMQGSPQDRFRREVLAYNGYGNRHAPSQGNHGRLTPVSSHGLGSDSAARGSIQSFQVPVTTQPAMPSNPMSQSRSAPVSSTAGLHTQPSSRVIYPKAAPTQLLSQECQRRRFNPEWQERVTQDGMYTCKVLLPNNIVVGDGKVYSDPLIAKQRAATKALPIVRSWPTGYVGGIRVPEGPRLAFNIGRRPRAPEPPRPRPNSHVQQPKIEGARDAIMTGTESSHEQQTNNFLTKEQTELFEKMCQTLEIKLPDPTKDSEEVQRAFLEGLALGSRIRRNRSSRSRSRSPRACRTSTGRGYDRDRSPARGRLTPPPKYDRWTGRPHTDRWRPDEDPLTNRPRTRESAKDEQQDNDIKMEVDSGKRASSQP
ncbi:hypothetical protein QBC38DRAFT_201672 [Podospora fimiseda]|uniref:Uncharacterized protein n=1 Tax=Podospora fimiseda TaxID=252190 RepID=A0AAN7BY12_9PEZI|nr:hypothetical protein QBC38DRAFT_201672 [Podospora fimiseda]